MPPKKILRNIGVATMETDDTILFQLRDEGHAGLTRNALFRISPTDPQYFAIIEHLGGFQPGEEKPVPRSPTHDIVKCYISDINENLEIVTNQ